MAAKKSSTPNRSFKVADQIQREIDIWHAYSDFYHYRFFVTRVT